ncbi:hypothetical protein SAMN06265365_11114 [Tistlia consotensis]|uniref:Uncharacterized protein n=1 Tax=Tistlia consotensis USBA 355 TaxID=560819 RepID=A0A1Y6BX41_9PROT|nr:hypothetical protein [Tistlia consotensis]SMF32113.1 hypothetical protein SAMN05428998_11115 [Tistlia consotensis USBA 355]SNR68145.1 hypothetical protein SAMN06265365_11114 [Tistlia consotensis]
MTTVRPPLARSLLALGTLLAAGLLLAGCRTDGIHRWGTAADAMSSGDRAPASEDDSAAAMRRLFSPLRTGPAGR